MNIDILREKNSLLLSKVYKKNKIVTNEEEYLKYSRKAIADGIIIVTSFGVITLSAYLANHLNDNFILGVVPGTLGIIGGSLRMLKNADKSNEIELGLINEREELYNIQHDYHNAGNDFVKKLTR
ncbi:MAG: hypothetical protein IJS56_02120 [Bacilli bacterium]|nr:hypothetical protein [Bacilli bacterium]